MWVLARNLGEILREFGEILGKYHILDDSSLGAKGLSDNFGCSGALSLNISDHLPIFVVRKKERIKKVFECIKGRTYKHYDMKIFQDVILSDPRWREFWKHGEHISLYFMVYYVENYY